MRLFFPIAKVDAEQRMVYGYASTAAKDDQGETVALPALQAALADYMKFANVREMHQLSAVGTAKEAAVDDKGLYVAAHVVDDPAWEKVKAGVYKGFSIGGRVTERNPSDSSNITGLKLAEISLVDRPANPEAVFDCWKAAGAGDDPAADPAPPETPPAPSVDEHIAAMGKVFADFEAMLDGLTKGGDEPGNGKKPYGDVEYADSGLQSDKKKRYPIDTKEHVRAAWAYINKEKNAKKYTAEQLAHIKGKIKAAARKFDIEISDDGKKASEALLRKSLGTISRLACCIQDMRWEAESLAQEAAMEGDDSDACERLKAIIAQLFDFLAGQLAEAKSEIADNSEVDGTVVVTLAAAADDLAKGESLSGERLGQLAALKKAAAGEDGPADTHSTTNTAGNPEHPAPQATPPAGPANPEANSTVDTEHGTHAQAIHDAAVAMGAKCAGAMAMAARVGEEEDQGTVITNKAAAADPGSGPGQDLAKLTAERDALAKAVAEMPERLAALAKRVEEIAATPLPPQTIARPAGLSVVGKAQDGGGAARAADEEIARAWAAMSKDEQTLALIKGARRAVLARPGITDGPAPGDPRALR